MVTHSYEEIEEQGATLFHFEFHGPAFLEVVAAANDESEILGSELRVRVRGMSVCVASAGEDC